MKHQAYESKALPAAWSDKANSAQSIKECAFRLMQGEIFTLFYGEQRFSLADVVSSLDCKDPAIVQECVQTAFLGRQLSKAATEAINEAAERVAAEMIDYMIQDAEEKAA